MMMERARQEHPTTPTERRDDDRSSPPAPGRVIAEGALRGTAGGACTTVVLWLIVVATGGSALTLLLLAASVLTAGAFLGTSEMLRVHPRGRDRWLLPAFLAPLAALVPALCGAALADGTLPWEAAWRLAGGREAYLLPLLPVSPFVTSSLRHLVGG